jgi:hypothetical protein
VEVRGDVERPPVLPGFQHYLHGLKQATVLQFSILACEISILLCLAAGSASEDAPVKGSRISRSFRNPGRREQTQVTTRPHTQVPSLIRLGKGRQCATPTSPVKLPGGSAAGMASLNVHGDLCKN